MANGATMGAAPHFLHGCEHLLTEWTNGANCLQRARTMAMNDKEHRVCGTSTRTTRRQWILIDPPLTLRANACRVDRGCFQTDSYEQTREARQMAHHPPPASRVTARVADRVCNDDSNRDAATAAREWERQWVGAVTMTGVLQGSG